MIMNKNDTYVANVLSYVAIAICISLCVSKYIEQLSFKIHNLFSAKGFELTNNCMHGIIIIIYFTS